ncbi:MAG: hypothetical protein ISP90_13965 [Nevskia sp.]|nr:hypothetical protein [Nevskia sp.]
MTRLRLQTCFWPWAAAMLALVAAFAAMLPALRVETSIFALLPRGERDAGLEQAVDAYTEQLSRDSVYLVGAGDFAVARDAAAAFAGALRSSGAFAEVFLEVGAARAQAARFYLPWRGGLLAERHRRWLASGQAQKLRDEALRALYTPAGFMRPFGAGEDPLGLLSAFVAGQRPPTGRATLRQGVLTVAAAGRDYVLVAAHTAASPFALAAERSAGAALAEARAAAQAAGAQEVVGSGVIQHAAAAAARGRAEMSLFGGISAAGSVVLLWLAFASTRPLLLTALSMALGGAAGLLACRLAFGGVHLVTLIFGSSLIGTSVDYSIYFFADRFRDPRHWRPLDAPRWTAAGIGLGYMTTALSYLALLAAPFPGLRQIALFSAAGLGVACGCVLILFPRLARPWPIAERAAALRLGAALERMRLPPRRGLRLALALAAGAFVAGGLMRLHFADDVRALQASPPELLRGEARVRELLGQSGDRRFVLVRGDSAEQVLQREEALRQRLAPLREDGRLGTVLALSNAVPSLRQQAADRQLLAAQVYAANGLLPGFQRGLGYRQDAIDRQLAAAAGARALQLDDFLASPAALPYRSLWLGRIAGGYASAVSLFDVRDPAALQQAADGLPGVQLVDKVAEISQVLHRYRQIAMALIAAVYLVIGALLSLRYGLAGAAATLLPAVGGGLLALAVLAWAGVGINLFHVLALLLVLGMGSDYTIFLRESRSAPAPALLAVALATLTATLSFGLLAFSATPFIHAIGATQALGIGFTVVLALGLRPPAARHAVA